LCSSVTVPVDEPVADGQYGLPGRIDDDGAGGRSPSTIAVNRAAALTKETSYLRLTRDAAVTAAVAELDRKILAEPVPPHVEPVVRGRLQKFESFSGDNRTLYRYVTMARGTPLLWNHPAHLCTDEMEALIADEVELAERLEQE
jgi:hypothetical protein